jgi:hypothetical protein
MACPLCLNREAEKSQSASANAQIMVQPSVLFAKGVL